MLLRKISNIFVPRFFEESLAVTKDNLTSFYQSLGTNGLRIVPLGRNCSCH